MSDARAPRAALDHDSAADGTSAWASRRFRWLWTGSTLSMFGAEIGELAIPLLALGSLSASAGGLSAIRTAQFLPFVIATLPLGVLVDHSRRRPLMIGADLGRFLAVGAIPVAVWTGRASVPLVCALMLVAGTLTVLFHTADFALLPRVVSRQQLTDANAKLSATGSAAEISGRGLGGLLVQAVTAPVAVLANAVGYLGSAVSLSRVTVQEPPPATRTGGRWSAVTAGLRIALGHRVLRGFLGGATTFNLGFEVYFLGLMLYLVDDLHVAAGLVGLVMVCGGGGSLVGSWFGPRLSRRFRYGRVLVGTLAMGNTAPLGAALAPLTRGHEVVVLAVVGAVMGVGIGISNAHVVTVRQLVAPPEAMGRLNAAYRFVSWGAIPVGAALAGVAASAFGAWGGMVLGAGIIATATLWVALSPVRSLVTLDDIAPATLR